MANNVETRLLILEKDMKDLRSDLDGLIDTVVATYQTKVAAATAEAGLALVSTNMASTVAAHTAKFAKVLLPAETQYYLKQQDIVGLKKIVAQAANLKISVDKSMKSLIAAWQRFQDEQNI